MSTAALQDICEYNDITEERLLQAPESITSIEMFLYNFPHICCMSFFPNLVSLSLVQQNLLSIEGLHCCPHLELLCLNENSIQRYCEFSSVVFKTPSEYFQSLHNRCVYLCPEIPSLFIASFEPLKSLSYPPLIPSAMNSEKLAGTWRKRCGFYL